MKSMPDKPDNLEASKQAPTSASSPQSNSNPTPLQSLLAKPVSRSHFLKISTLGIFSIFGLSTIIHFFTGKQSSVTKIVSSTITPTPTKYGHRLPISKQSTKKVSG